MHEMDRIVDDEDSVLNSAEPFQHDVTAVARILRSLASGGAASPEETCSPIIHNVVTILE